MRATFAEISIRLRNTLLAIAILAAIIVAALAWRSAANSEAADKYHRLICARAGSYAANCEGR